MLKKTFVLFAIFLTAVLIVSCAGAPATLPQIGDPSEFVDPDWWSNPDFNMDEVTDIGNEWTLDLSEVATMSWSDGDRWGINPQAEVAAATPNPAGGYNFAFDRFNQRVIFVLNSSQIYSIYRANQVEVIIDGEANSNAVNFRYHIGNSELGSNWNASNSPGEAPFNNIRRATLTIDRVGRGPDLQDTIRNFMIQSRGGANADTMTPVTLTIRSITFRIVS